MAENTEIIETYWNVNYKIGCCRGGGNWEIIETYWNVNYKMRCLRLSTVKEIIETYWNVNFLSVDIRNLRNNGNNRNILECKF